MGKAIALVKKSPRAMLAMGLANDPTEATIKDLFDARAAYAKHWATVLDPEYKRYEADRARGPVSAARADEYFKHEAENTALYNRLGDAEDALMTHEGPHLLDCYARLLGAWSFLSRGSAQSDGYDGLAVRDTLDAIAKMLGRPGSLGLAPLE